MSNYCILKNQEAFLSLPEEDKQFLRDYKHHEQAIKMQIERILHLQTAFSSRLYNWVNKNAVNRSWYLKNINQIVLSEDGIQIFGEFLALKDRENTIQNNFIWSKDDISVSLPDWAMIVKRFPQKSRESFFQEVLQMSGKYLGSSSDTIATSKDTVVLQSALYTRGKLRRK